MSGGYLVYELLAAQASVLLIAMMAVGLSTLVVGLRAGSPRRLGLDPGASDAGVVERVALAVSPPRQADPDARGAHRPRAPDSRSAAAA
jgi:hypothetical protein